MNFLLINRSMYSPNLGMIYAHERNYTSCVPPVFRQPLVSKILFFGSLFKVLVKRLGKYELPELNFGGSYLVTLRISTMRSIPYLQADLPKKCFNLEKYNLRIRCN